MRPWRKSSNILLIVLKSRKTVPDAAQPKQLSEGGGGGGGGKCDKIRKAKPGVLDEVSELER